MKKRRMIVLCAVIMLLAVAALCVWMLQNRHAPIDEWSSTLAPESIEWAEAAEGFGIEEKNYAFTSDEFPMLAELLSQINEQNSRRKYPEGAEKIEYRLAVFADGKLWLFHCYTNNIVALTFNDPETAAYFGCEGSLLYIEHEALWQLIADTVEQRAE